MSSSPCVLSSDSTDMGGPIVAYARDETIDLGVWHTESEEERDLRHSSLLIHLTDDDVSRSDAAVTIQLWGKSGSQSKPQFLCTLKSDAHNDACRWFYISDVAEWVDERSMADDLPLVDYQRLFLVVSACVACALPAVAGVAQSKSTTRKLLTQMQERKDTDFDSDVAITLYEEDVSDSGDASRSLSHAGPGGKGGSAKKKKGKFDNFCDAIETQIEESNENSCASQYIIWALVAIVVILIILYVIYRLYVRWTRLEECCDNHCGMSGSNYEGGYGSGASDASGYY